MTLSEIRGKLDAQRLFDKLLSPEDASALTMVKAERLVELAASGHAPSIYIDQQGPFFIRRDLIEWVKANLVQATSGRACRVAVVLPEDPICRSKDVPDRLRAMADHLREFNGAAICGVYFLIKGGKIVYVGQSVNIPGRIGDHRKHKDFDRVLYLLVPESELNEVEGAFIRALKPEMNGPGPLVPAAKLGELLTDYGLTGVVHEEGASE